MPASTAVVQNGRAIITSRLIGTATAIPGFVGWGTGTTAVLTTDTALATEDTGGSPAYARVAASSTTQTTTTTTNDTHTVIGTITSNGTKTINEAGLFTVISGTGLYVRGVLATGISVALNDTVQFTFNVQITSAVV